MPTPPADPGAALAEGPTIFLTARAASLVFRALDPDRAKNPRMRTIVKKLGRIDQIWQEASAGTSASGTTQAPSAELGAPSNWLTTAEVATQLGITPRRVRAELEAANLVGHKRGRSWFISIEEFQRYRASR